MLMVDVDNTLDFAEVDERVLGKKSSEGKKASPSAREEAIMFADVVSLLLNSTVHDHLFLSDLKWLVLPPLRLGQCKMYRQKGIPVAFACWARLSPELEKEFIQNRRLRPNDWDTGNRYWLVDLIAPYGSSSKVIENLEKSAFKGIPVQTIQFKGNKFETVQLDNMLAHS